MNLFRIAEFFQILDAFIPKLMEYNKLADYKEHYYRIAGRYGSDYMGDMAGYERFMRSYSFNKKRGAELEKKKSYNVELVYGDENSEYIELYCDDLDARLYFFDKEESYSDERELYWIIIPKFADCFMCLYLDRKSLESERMTFSCRVYYHDFSKLRQVEQTQKVKELYYLHSRCKTQIDIHKDLVLNNLDGNKMNIF